MTNDIDEFFSSDRTSGREEGVSLADDTFRDHLYPLDDPVLEPYRGMSYEEFTADRYQAPFLRELLAYWQTLYEEPFVGITTDGVPRSDVFPLPERPLGDDTTLMAAASALVGGLTDGQSERLRYPIDAPTWRAWSNPEFVFHRVGLRLEDEDAATVDAVFELVRASLSTPGYERVRETMGLNADLGELVGLPTIMNDQSYWFALYGDPSLEGPWGWQLFGHHVAVHFVTVGGRHVVAPVFLGGEPALSDTRAPLFAAREELALTLAGSLDDAQRADAVVYASVLDPAMPEGRLHPADERHVAGAFRDNRIVPYEGLELARLDNAQYALVRAIVSDFLLLLRDEQRVATLAEFDAHRDDAWFSWYGATDGSTPFYFRVHGPVLIAELDHHAGVWLSNRLPARFHVHTTLRMTNGNDYGHALRQAWRVSRHSSTAE